MFAWKGAFDYVRPEFEGCYCSDEFLTFELDSKRIDIKFLNYYFNQSKIWTEVEQFCIGFTKASRNRFKEKFFLEMDFSLPPLLEQQRIVARLEGLKNKIDSVRILRGEQIKQIERLKKQFLGNVFEQLRKSLGNRLGFKPIATVANLERGRFSHRPRNAPHLFEKGIYPFIQTGEVARAIDNKIEYNQTLNEEGLKVSRLFKANTVLVTIAANIGNVAILDYDACFPDSVVSIRPNSNLDLDFLFFFMKTQKEYLDNISTSTSQKNINIQKLETITIPLPDLTTQREIVATIKAALSKFDNLIAEQIAQLTLLNGLLPSVLEKAFKGDW